MPESRSAGGIAEGTIVPARFVKVGIVGEGGVLQAGSGDVVLGIAFRETRRSDYLDTSNTAALINEPVSYYTAGARCMLELGGTVTLGDYVKPNTNGDGTGITAGSDGNNYGARALQSGVSGEFIRVEVIIGQRGA